MWFMVTSFFTQSAQAPKNLEKTLNNLRILAGYPSKTDHQYRKIVEHCNFDGGKDDKQINTCFFVFLLEP